MIDSLLTLVDSFLGLLPCVAGLQTLGPRVFEVCVPSASAVLEPRAVASATTQFAGFRHGAALGAYSTARRRRGCWCLCAGDSPVKTKTYEVKTVIAVTTF